MLGAFYNKATLARLGLQVPTTFDEFQHSLAVAKAPGRAADHGRQPRPLADGPRVHGAAGPLRRPQRHLELDVRPLRRQLRRRRHPQGRRRSCSSGARRATSRTASTASARPTPPPASARARASTSSPAPGRTRPSPARSRTASASSRCRRWTAVPGAPTTGSLSLPYHISSKSQNPAVAAAFINFITDPHAAGIVIDNGDLPAAAPRGRHRRSASRRWRRSRPPGGRSRRRAR